MFPKLLNQIKPHYNLFAFYTEMRKKREIVLVNEYKDFEIILYQFEIN